MKRIITLAALLAAAGMTLAYGPAMALPTEGIQALHVDHDHGATKTPPMLESVEIELDGYQLTLINRWSDGRIVSDSVELPHTVPQLEYADNPWFPTGISAGPKHTYVRDFVGPEHWSKALESEYENHLGQIAHDLCWPPTTTLETPPSFPYVTTTRRSEDGMLVYVDIECE